MDEDGYVTIAGRSREVIISGGVNVYPAQVERVIAAHPRVPRRPSFGVADEQWGETPAAAVRLHPGPPLDAEDIRTLVAEQMDRRARPGRVVFMEDFPALPPARSAKHELVPLID